jgi:hypothetical protein
MIELMRAYKAHTKKLLNYGDPWPYWSLIDNNSKAIALNLATSDGAILFTIHVICLVVSP